MPAPPSDLVTALREGTAHRHIFFKLAHSEGDLFVWDGIREFVFNGDTYSGIGGFAQIDGASQSKDLQNHEIIVTLNGVGLPTLSETSLDVRDEAVNIWAAWITESGTVLGYRLIFSGLGNTLLVEADGDSIALKLKARGAFADWRVSPRAYYTDAEQQRRFPGDTGFSYIRYLENANIAGWSINEESGGGIPTRYRAAIGTYISPWFQDSISKGIIGDHTLGPTPRCVGAGTNIQSAGGKNYIEDTTSAALGFDVSSPYQMKLSGVACYIDTSNDVRTPGGKLAYLSGGSTANNKLRVHGAITATGTASGKFPRLLSTSGYSQFYSTAGPLSMTNNDQTALIYCNCYGPDIRSISTDPRPFDYREFLATGTKVYYVEDVTGTQVDVLYSGSFRLRVGGADCTISSTGLVLSPAGRKIVRQGGDAAQDFLRIWT